MRVSHFVTLLSGGVGIESVSPTLLDTPADATYPSNVYARSVWALRAWAGYLFAGTGDSAHNVTAPPILNTTDGSTWSDTDGVTFADHQIDRFVLTGGVLWIPGHDPTSGTTGNLYRHVSANTWSKSTPVTLSACAHVYDLLDDDTYLWAAVGASSGSNSIRRSSDDGATWTPYAAPGSGMDVTPTRAWTFFTIDGTLYASTNYAYYTSPPAWSAYNDPWVNTVKWNGSAWVTSGVQFAPNDTLQVQYTEVEPEVFEISSVGRIAKAVTFGSRVFYIVGQTVTNHDFSPTNLYSVTAALTPTRLTFMGGAKVHDLLVHNNACYALCNELVGDTYTTTVYVTSDGTNWTGALTFRHSDTYTYARCMQFFGGELYLGYACYYGADGAGAGKIVKTPLTHVIILAGGGVAPVAPVNTVAPAVSGTATIGQTLSVTDGTWTGTAPITYTYQWKRGGSNISGATNSTYVLVDADWGYAITCTVTATNAAGAVTADSNATSLVVDAAAQVLGSELLANPGFTTWSGDNPSSWTVLGESGSDPVVTEVASGGGAGTGFCKLFNSATAAQPSVSQAVMSVGSYYECSLLVDTVAAGSVRMFDISNPLLGFVTSTTGTKRGIGRSANATIRIRAEASNTNVVVDDASLKLVTLNGQLVAPSANMRADFFYTLPGSPVLGDQVWLMPRISDFAAGNYWLAHLEYTGAQWNITLYSVATFTRTSRTNASNIGTTNGIRVNCNGDTIKLYTTANGGSVWTQRGSNVSNSTYNTATGVNALWVSTVTPGNLVYAPAD